VIGLATLPEVGEGTDLPAMLAEALAREIGPLDAGDVLVVAQKIVSKAEGCAVRLADVEPSPFAEGWSAWHGKDPRKTELILRESRRVVRMDRGVLITETRHGFICANAGVDTSNVRPELALTLPRDPDASARRIREGIAGRTGTAVGVIVCDTFGRPWRAGLTNVALGVAGIRVLDDYRGSEDAFGRTLQASVIAVADEIASAAELVMGKTRGVPAALVRGLDVEGDDNGRRLLRRAEDDLFR
jgi:coenzyme F420-0:L-glutamate ligase/coenzyme F420-1:gamma-L-glutamate ligase